MSSSWLPTNLQLNRIPKRAESRQADQLRATFVDSGVAIALDVVDHQVLYGRRGTGKTHVLRYLESEVRRRGDISIYVDLRTTGTPEGIFLSTEVDPAERAGRLLVDMLVSMHESLLAAALNDDLLIEDSAFVDCLDSLLHSISTVRIVGNVEQEMESEQATRRTDGSSAQARIEPGGATLRLGTSANDEDESRLSRKLTRAGSERRGMNFGEVARALRSLANAMGNRRVWLLLDEWIGVPYEVQPYLAEFLVRCVLPLQMFTVKIAAIEQQSNFLAELPGGGTIGIELGADVTANLDLDEFMVFEQNEAEARAFFMRLIYLHLKVELAERGMEDLLGGENDLIALCFTDARAFDEFVRSAEGVPRDAINIIGAAARTARDSKISVPDIRRAAQSWYQSDKAGALRSRSNAQGLLNWIIDAVIRDKKARGFLVNQKEAQSSLLHALFDARVLHLMRKGYSAQDTPGERFDVYVIDYGAYVDLLATKNSPQGMLPLWAEDQGDAGFVDVPTSDLRSLRRAILDLSKYPMRS